ncbi:LAGLIDADG family homing endonuclease [Candidatus Woesearchaeota archaeon]|nr:LAGLIDADG family homing endonuclease [Candidatus Woesearchaeota archaeon]
MDAVDRAMIIDAYEMGMSIREVVDFTGGVCGRESIRIILKGGGVPLRGRGVKYRDASSFFGEEVCLFAELLGCMYGDGSLSKNKNAGHGCYDAVLVFSADERDVVERIAFITSRLFGFEPRVIDKGYFCIKLRRSFARYLHEFGYPLGKKSVLNPVLPLSFLVTPAMQKAFLRGFFNAEASVHKTVCVHQSVRIFPDKQLRKALFARGKPYTMKNIAYRICGWCHVKDLFEERPASSNILLGVQELLLRIGIPSTIYPIRVHISGAERVSIHYELRIRTKYLKTVADSGLLSSRKKVRKLQQLCGRAGAVK